MTLSTVLLILLSGMVPLVTAVVAFSPQYGGFGTPNSIPQGIFMSRPDSIVAAPACMTTQSDTAYP